MGNIIVGVLIVFVVVYFYKKINKKYYCCCFSSEQNNSTTTTNTNANKIEVLEEPKNTVGSTNENKNEEFEKEDILEVTLENLPDIIELYRPNEATIETIKNLVKDIYSKQVEPLSYSTIYKYIANSYGYRTWKEFKNILETK